MQSPNNVVTLDAYDDSISQSGNNISNANTIPVNETSTKTEPVNKTTETVKVPEEKEEEIKKQETEEVSEEKKEETTKETTEEEESSEPVIIPELLKKLGITELKDDAGKPISFLNEAGGEDVDSLVKVVDRLSNTRATEVIKDLHAKVPQYKALLEYALNGGNPYDLLEIRRVDYSKIQLDTKTEKKEEQWLEIITKNLQETGVDAQLALETAKLYIDSGKGKDLAEKSLKDLQLRQATIEQAKQKETAEAATKQRAQEEAYWTNIEDLIVNKGKLGDWELPVDKKFREQAFLSIVPRHWSEEHGRYVSDAELFKMSLPLEVQIQEAMRLGLKFDVSKIVKQEVRKAKSSDLKTLIAKSKTTETKPNEVNKKGEKLISGISLSDMERSEVNFIQTQRKGK